MSGHEKFRIIQELSENDQVLRRVEGIHLNFSIRTLEGIRFSNCSFEGDLIISYCQFDNCKFSGILVSSNCQFLGSEFFDVIGDTSFSLFSRCSFKETTLEFDRSFLYQCKDQFDFDLNKGFYEDVFVISNKKIGEILKKAFWYEGPWKISRREEDKVIVSTERGKMSLSPPW